LGVVAVTALEGDQIDEASTRFYESLPHKAKPGHRVYKNSDKR
jgi:hypothetical protein